MTLYENMVLQFIADDLKIRLIFIDNCQGFCCSVNLNSDTCMPKIIEIKELNELIESGQLLIVPDPYTKIIDEQDIPNKYIEVRDKNWMVIERLWLDNKISFLDKKARSMAIKLIAMELGYTELQVKRIITRFFQRGMTKNSLLYDYVESGGKGKIRRVGNKKRGRKKGVEKDGSLIEGIDIDEVNAKIIRTSIKLYYSNKNKKSLNDAYTYMLRKFYSDKLMLDGEEKVLVWDKSTIPTYRQFVYWYHKFSDERDDIIKRESVKYFELHNRELLSNSTVDIYGPGARYQIDATVADVYLVSVTNQDKIIGRPIVYAVIDVFSRMVCGIYVGLEGPSWLGAMMALDNVVEDKVEFCSHYDIDLTSEVWPNSALPEKILADRGEFEGYNVENLINNLNVKVENTPPYRGDLKGIVERNFRTINERIKHMTPGAISKQFRERGDRDYRLDAVLNLNEFTAIIINEVVAHNNRVISNYPLNIDLIKDDVVAVPTHIWNWGIVNRRCAFKFVDKDIVRLNLMYRKKVTITRKGIQFNTKMYYSCDIAIKEEWFIRKVNQRLDIVYDPRGMNYIYIIMDKGKHYIKCTMLDKCSEYKDLSIEEITFLNELEIELINEYKNKQNQINIDNIENAEKIIENARSRSKSILSNAQRIRRIRDNRASEKEERRNEESFVLDKSKNNINNDISSDNTDVKDTKYKSKMELFKKIRGEKNGD